MGSIFISWLRGQSILKHFLQCYNELGFGFLESLSKMHYTMN
jgi:hypothetical protein